MKQKTRSATYGHHGRSLGSSSRKKRSDLKGSFKEKDPKRKKKGLLGQGDLPQKREYEKQRERREQAHPRHEPKRIKRPEKPTGTAFVPDAALEDRIRQATPADRVDADRRAAELRARYAGAAERETGPADEAAWLERKAEYMLKPVPTGPSKEKMAEYKRQLDLGAAEDAERRRKEAIADKYGTRFDPTKQFEAPAGVPKQPARKISPVRQMSGIYRGSRELKSDVPVETGPEVEDAPALGKRQQGRHPRRDLDKMTSSVPSGDEIRARAAGQAQAIAEAIREERAKQKAQKAADAAAEQAYAGRGMSDAEAQFRQAQEQHKRNQERAQFEQSGFDKFVAAQGTTVNPVGTRTRGLNEPVAIEMKNPTSAKYDREQADKQYDREMEEYDAMELEEKHYAARGTSQDTNRAARDAQQKRQRAVDILRGGKQAATYKTEAAVGLAGMKKHDANVDAQTEAHSRENPTLYLDHTVAEEIKATKKRRRAEAEQKIIDEIRGPGGPNDVHAVLDGGTQFVHAVRLPKKRAIAAPVRTQTEVAPREFMEKKKPEAMGGKRPRDEGSEVIGGPKAVKYKRIVEPDNMREHKRLLQLKKDANRLRGSHAMDNQLNFLKEQHAKLRKQQQSNIISSTGRALRSPLGGKMILEDAKRDLATKPPLPKAPVNELGSETVNTQPDANDKDPAAGDIAPSGTGEQLGSSIDVGLRELETELGGGEDAGMGLQDLAGDGTDEFGPAGGVEALDDEQLDREEKAEEPLTTSPKVTPTKVPTNVPDPVPTVVLNKPDLKDKPGQKPASYSHLLLRRLPGGQFPSTDQKDQDKTETVTETVVAPVVVAPVVRPVPVPTQEEKKQEEEKTEPVVPSLFKPNYKPVQPRKKKKKKTEKEDTKDKLLLVLKTPPHERDKVRKDALKKQEEAAKKKGKVRFRFRDPTDTTPKPVVTGTKKPVGTKPKPTTKPGTRAKSPPGRTGTKPKPTTKPGTRAKSPPGRSRSPVRGTRTPPRRRSRSPPTRSKSPPTGRKTRSPLRGTRSRSPARSKSPPARTKSPPTRKKSPPRGTTKNPAGIFNRPDRKPAKVGDEKEEEEKRDPPPPGPDVLPPPPHPTYPRQNITNPTQTSTNTSTTQTRTDTSSTSDTTTNTNYDTTSTSRGGRGGGRGGRGGGRGGRGGRGEGGGGGTGGGGTGGSTGPINVHVGGGGFGGGGGAVAASSSSGAGSSGGGQGSGAQQAGAILAAIQKPKKKKQSGITAAKKRYTDKRKVKLGELRALKSKRTRQHAAGTKKLPAAVRTKHRKAFKEKVNKQYKEVTKRFPPARGLKDLKTVKELIAKLERVRLPS
jgi:hypothetical protein